VSQNHPTLIFAAGGTGGHLFPALAIADEVRAINPNTAIVFVGTKERIEARVVPQSGYEFRTIWAAGVQRRLSLNNLLVPLKLVVSLIQSFFVIRRVRPNVVVGTGGYVCGPVLLAASLRGIPTVIHESNSIPGVTTRLLAGRAARVFLGFEDAAKSLKRKDNVQMVGTPTRRGLEGARRDEGIKAFGLELEKNTVLIFGGSHGASSLNRAILSMVDTFIDAGTQVIWQTGYGQLEHIRQQLGERRVGWVGSFIDSMELSYAAADVVVCRAGAMTIAEITRAGKPAILVPLPHATEDHQTHNAMSLVRSGAAEVIRDADLQLRLESVLMNLVNNKALLGSMAASSKRLGRPNAGRHVAEYLLQLASH
jgi:UDP-N-acetylglucosamine--N-acetylmuramyl-(pentapeptide) pyrophosphoryl-undecaprenol N-acetylglucosamine transferase